jgi:hypothetical protein
MRDQAAVEIARLWESPSAQASAVTLLNANLNR